MRLIAEKTGLNIEFVNGYTWDQLLQKLRAGEIDVLPAIYDSTDRRAYTAFTKSYYSQPSVIVVRQDSKNISDLTELSGKRVAAAQGYAI
ncbi:MAG: transporter substrate-binding domain-containing protein, partial [Candidatus Dadabacteria bacterium]|nr:transporter substrate-binding domain-containing protein [Candidatus Dadabacteria bacterium]